MIQNKNIIRLSFIGLFINIIANIVLYRYFIIEEVILKQIADQNIYFAEVYKSGVWDRDHNVISKLKNRKYQNLLQDENFIRFAQESSSFFKNINANVTVYDEWGQKILASHETSIKGVEKVISKSYYDQFFSYLDKYFLKDYAHDNGLAEAFNGRIIHSLIFYAVALGEGSNYSERAIVNSYIPIINSSAGKFSIGGALEITVDITTQWKNITYLEKRIFVAFVIVFLVFFIIVMYNTNYAQQVINKQTEVNKELEEAKNRAEMESSSKTEFLANISHELRTPLNAIIGFSEIILSETYGKLENAHYKDYIGDINSSGKHLLSVINDILDFSKVSTDKLKVDKIELDLNKLAAASMRFVKPRADKASIKLIEDFPEEHIVIYADPKRLKQALLNLLSNSVKFTRAKGSVTLSIRTDAIKKNVYISVIDTGIGMSDQDIPKALSSFGQVDNTLSRKYEGTGLGLPLTKKLIELMEGTFDIKSSPGEGTTVTIVFEYMDSIEL